MKLSVVIPVYLVENTLERCVRSVLQQDYEDMQIILVDDGSTDHSPAICEWLAAQDKRISVIHQQNRGLAAARNTGIRSAQGSYITFVDSDDYLDNNTYLPLMHELGNHPEYDILEYPVLIKEGGKHMFRLSFVIVCSNSLLNYRLIGKG
jgi:glycosyltransferase involved in cell wall biosynthesis